MKHSHYWRLLLVPFFLWHMFAVAVYVVPDEEKREPIRSSVDALLPYVRPYLLTLSLWQKWNIFAPDPIRWVSTYVIEEDRNGVWQSVLAISPETLPWWRQSSELKLLRSFEDWGRNDRLLTLYLQEHCRRTETASGTTVRIVRSYFTLPNGEELRNAGGWKNTRPYQSQVDTLSTITCRGS